MKSRLFVLLLTALFIVGNVFAGTPLEDELVLKGEFSQIGGRSVKPELRVEVCSKCHPFYTGQQKAAQARGRIDKFNKKYGMDK